MLRGAVIDLERDGPRIAGRIVAGVLIGHRAQHRLIVGKARRSGQRQDAGLRIVAAGDAALRREVQHLTRLDPGDLDRGTGERRAVDVRQSERRIDDSGCAVLGEDRRRKAVGHIPGLHRRCRRPMRLTAVVIRPRHQVGIDGIDQRRQFRQQCLIAAVALIERRQAQIAQEVVVQRLHTIRRRAIVGAVRRVLGRDVRQRRAAVLHIPGVFDAQTREGFVDFDFIRTVRHIEVVQIVPHHRHRRRGIDAEFLANRRQHVRDAPRSRQQTFQR